ncbi:MAG: GTP 3',8-cyclase MoaA [Proteobacteria bacterium]|nr:GTP 3',8-cyclase MoaA [Cystobacterineae bacterium]MCL2258542.1 GTP 3',8-cyclase MoaA [Cystobacterineae bacterium]MCL2315121.1 GTP 3',8-cyclase MoaA [Pseudomonadota bacterium]
MVFDTYHRAMSDLRLSLTDRCNLRCFYCMPRAHYSWLAKTDVLSFEEISALVSLFLSLGIRKLRLTGGEPLVRKGLAKLVHLLAQKPQLEDFALTTNGVELAPLALPLKEAGLHRLNISLDSLQPKRFEQISKRNSLHQVLLGIDAATQAGFPKKLKLDTVVIRGFNDDELPALLQFANERNAEIRFIEYMDVAGAVDWSSEQVVSQQEMLQRIENNFGPTLPLEEIHTAPAKRYQLANGTTFGIIASTSSPFCDKCNRVRLSADGKLFPCLYANEGLDLKKELRTNKTSPQLQQLITSFWKQRTEKGAAQRLLSKNRRAFKTEKELLENPHLEMHKRGG